MEESGSFLGTGWSFPPTFEKNGKNTLITVSDELDIQQSLNIILNTQLGERVMRPDFGASLNDLVFESINANVISDMIARISRAITFFEPRIELDNVSMDRSSETEGVVDIFVNYIVRETNDRGNIVFPFFLVEGTNII